MEREQLHTQDGMHPNHLLVLLLMMLKQLEQQGL
jgi:hypothetical protein